MIDFLDDQGKAPRDLLNIKVAQDTESRDAPATLFAWPEMKKFAMATPRDVLTSTIYFGLYGEQLDGDVAEKVAERLRRSADAFNLQPALEKIAVLPNYSQLSQQDLTALSQDDRPSSRLIRRLKRMLLYGAGGAGGGAILSKVVRGKVSPLWAALPGALTAGVGLAKSAEESDVVEQLLNQFYGENNLDSALKYVEDDIETHAPPERRKYAQRLKSAADACGKETPDVIEQYASSGYGPRLQVAMEMRFPISEEYAELAEKQAELSPQEFADHLYTLDMKTGVVVNNRIPDAYYSTFGKVAVQDEVLLVVDDEPVKSSFLGELAKSKDKLGKVVAANIANGICEQPHKFLLLGPELQKIIVRAVRREKSANERPWWDMYKEPAKVKQSRQNVADFNKANRPEAFDTSTVGKKITSMAPPKPKVGDDPASFDPWDLE